MIRQPPIPGPQATPHGTPAPHPVAQVGARLAEGGVAVEVFASAALPTRHGPFQIYVFRNSLDDTEHVALVAQGTGGTHAAPGGRGLPAHAAAAPTHAGAAPAPYMVRLHSECLTGDVLTSLRCDCRDQLEMAMAHFARRQAGILLYMRQEGRGIGLGNKIRAYALQEGGLDTIDANRHLGFDDDLRDYRVAALMLRALGVHAIALATNNPRKLQALQGLGIAVVQRVPLVAPANGHNAHYLATKRHRAGHLFGEGDV